MDNNKGISILASSMFPSQLEPFTTKLSEEWGRNLAKAIESEWFYRDSGGKCKFYTGREAKIERRLYAKGLQSMEKYYDAIGTNGDRSLLNLPKKPLSIIPKLVNVICNGFANRDYSIKAFSIDPISSDNRLSYRKKLENDMYGMPVLKKAKETFGVDVSNVPMDQVPETKEELELHMQMEYKPSIELSAELAIATIFGENRYKETTEMMNRKDLTILGEAWAKHRFVPSKGIVLEYVDPVNKIHSYSDDPFFRDCFYHAEFKTVLISDVLVEYPFLNTPEYADARERLGHCQNDWFAYHGLKSSEKIKGTVNLLFFTYKTTRERQNKIEIKPTGGKVVKTAVAKGEKKELKNPNLKFTSVMEEVEFEGVLVLGTDILLKWNVAEDMVRSKSNKQGVIGQYIGVAPEREGEYIDSLVARMMPIEDNLNIVELKAIQIIQRITPDGYVIDPMAISDIDLGEGTLSPQNMLNMLLQTGSIFANSYASNGDSTFGKLPITEFRTGDSLNKLTSLRNERMGYTDLMRDVIGLNKASDASSPDKDSLVGIQKLASLNSNTATRHILDASCDIGLRISEAALYRASDLLKFSDLKEDFARKIGATAVMDIEHIMELTLHDFAIFLELAPDLEEQEKMEADLTREIEKGFIGSEDKYRIMSLTNHEQRVGLLNIIKKKRAKLDEERKLREHKALADENIRASQSAEQFKQATAQLEGQVKSAVQEMINNGMLAKVAAEGQINAQNLELEYGLKNELQLIINQGQSAKQSEAEDRKDSRTFKQAEQQSRMIEQRNKENASAIPFESEQRGLEAFELNV